ncbi:hypothetical protein LXL04_009680 [Taraxacum kok-saghyz]
MNTRNLEVLDMMRFLGGAVTQTLQKDGVVRLKIMVKRKQLEQVLEKVVKKNDRQQREVSCYPAKIINRTTIERYEKDANSKKQTGEHRLSDLLEAYPSKYPRIQSFSHLNYSE